MTQKNLRSAYPHGNVESGPPSEMPNIAARFEPTASMTARISSIRCSRVGNARRKRRETKKRLD